jgi:anaerobic magnesium-protoporphyrin IX monomethyl ester cyclase
LDAGVLGCMQTAGIKTLNLALITTSASQLKRFARPDTVSDLDRVLSLARGLGLKAVVYLIIAAPGQDPYESVADLHYLARRRAIAGISVFYPAPGSPDFQWCRKQALLPTTLGQLRATALPVSHATDRRQAVTLLRLGRILNFMKSILDLDQRLPLPAKPPRRTDPRTDRITIGRQLLAAFFRDGNIYGIDADGWLYSHCIDPALAHAFLKGLNSATLQGAGP